MDHLEINEKGWDSRTAIHLDSDFYQHKAFMAGADSLKEIEIPLLGDVKGLKVLHLQCHFGQDSISLARRGAEVCAVDLSPKAIEQGKSIAEDLGLSVEFICSDVLAEGLLEGRMFDLVFTSYGVIPWLKELSPWGKLIADKLRPGGRLVFVEFHPVVHMFDDDMQSMAYSYFRDSAITGSQEGTYAVESADDEIPYVVWNHSLAETCTALLDAGLRIDSLQEYPYSPYPCFPKMRASGEGRYVLEDYDSKMPMCFSITASK